MKPFLRHALFASAMLILPTGAAFAAPEPGEETAQPQDNGDIIVTGTLDTPTTTAAGLSLKPREVPQSVTIIDRQRIQDFALTNVNDLLNQVVGINVERVETDRTYFNSRGFDITNFQVDGIGLPLLWGIQFGDLGV
jgi:outer membrane receptor for ferric coprogen and ferric-rhodotorulic acid